MPHQQLTWFITGCSTGFGSALVQSILARGDRVVATARNPDAITHAAHANLHRLALDVTWPEARVSQVVAEALKKFGGVDVLVSNAGISMGGTVEEIELATYQNVMDVNLYGAMKPTRALLPHFRQKRSGTVVFIGSMYGWAGCPVVSPYAVSKFALEGYAESLQQEVAPFGIKTLMVNPGFFRTAFIKEPSEVLQQTELDDYKPLFEQMLEFGRIMKDKQPGDPQKAVEIILDVVRGEGCAEAKGMPARLPLGSDVLPVIRNKCEETLKICKEWEEVIHSTNFAE